MRVLLDHCMPRPFGALLVGHHVRTTREMGWEELENGKLLKAAVCEFDVMVTIDRSLMHQQDLASLPLAVIVIRSRSNRVQVLAAWVPDILKLLAQALRRRIYLVGESR